MARDTDGDSAPAGTQSKRPPLSNGGSDSHSDTTNTPGLPAHPLRTRPLQKHHHVGRLHARVPSSKAVHKQLQQHAQASGAPAAKLNRRTPSPSEPDTSPRPPHRRVASELKLPSRSPALLSESASHTSLKRNRSNVDVSKRNRSSDKLKRSSSGTGIHASKPGRSQVHFDLGSDNPEDEWVDASGSNSPYLSRKGSLNSSAQSSLRPGAIAPQPGTSSIPKVPSHVPVPSSLDRQTSHHKEYLTSRLLQRTPSHGAPPKMTADIARAARPRLSPSLDSTDPDVSPPLGPNQDELTSRFVDVPGSTLTSQGSFYCPPGSSRRSDEIPRRAKSIAALTPRNAADIAPWTENDDSVLVPKPARRTTAQPAETSRIQQKLNLQRASSVLEPGQAVTGVGGVVGLTPLIGVGGPGFDGGNSRDPRVGKLLERTGMEYLVVRRYQNSVARSLSRLGRSQGTDKSRRIPRGDTPSINGKKSSEAMPRHMRNVSMPDTRVAATAKRSASIRTMGTGSSFEGDDVSRLNERLSGASLVGAEEEDGTTALLRHLWEKSTDYNASTD